jgi:hypothetical protein
VYVCAAERTRERDLACEVCVLGVGPRTKQHLMNDLAAGPREENERAKWRGEPPGPSFFK